MGIDSKAIVDAMCGGFLVLCCSSLYIDKPVKCSHSKDLCQVWEIDYILTSPYHPKSDKALESCHVCLKRKLKINLLKEMDGMRLFAYHDSLSVTTFRL